MNTSYIERQKAKEREMREAMTDYTTYDYNFCRPVRTLRLRGSDVRWRKQPPRDGRRLDRSRLVIAGMAYFPRLSTLPRHHPSVPVS